MSSDHKSITLVSKKDEEEVVPVILVKAHSRCNINCTYCYMYNLGDQTALEKPKRMSEMVAGDLILRAIEYAKAQSFRRMQIVFHGGEPLLAGRSFFRSFLRMARNAASKSGIEFIFTVQTNGILLNDAWCRFFAEEGVTLGVSIDGVPRLHDRYRVTHSGAGTYKQVLRGWMCAKSHGLQTMILTVVNPASSPQEVFHHLSELEPSQIDLLLPEAWLDSPPNRSGGGLPHANWLMRFFDLWQAQRPPKFRVPLFDRMMHRLMFENGSSDGPILDERYTIIVDTDGEVSCMDLIRGAIPGSAKSGYFVSSDTFESALAGNPILRKYTNAGQLPAVCKDCQFESICGGGAISHRFSVNKGFDNPSVYCPDLTVMIKHVQTYSNSISRIDLARQMGMFG